jgi:ornithine cyclodeaminase/alanine dehydrogenase
MEDCKFLYLSQEDIVSLNITWQEIIESVRLALTEHGEKTVENPPKPGVHSKDNSFIHAMPSYLKQMGTLGIKWVSGYPDNHKHDLPSIGGVIVLNSAVTGQVLSIMDCRWVTAVRTAAVSALAALKLARSHAKTLGIVGAGVQGTMNTIALSKVIPTLEQCKVFDIRKESMDRFVDNAGSASVLDIVKTGSVEDAVSGCDIVVSATQKMYQPIVKFEWLKAGVLALPLESNRAWHDEALFGVDKFVIDDLEQGRLYQRGGAFQGGIPDVYAETGEIVAGIKPGRENDSEKIMAINIGLACEDISLGTYIYEKAQEQKVGLELSLMKEDKIEIPA